MSAALAASAFAVAASNDEFKPIDEYQVDTSTNVMVSIGPWDLVGVVVLIIVLVLLFRHDRKRRKAKHRPDDPSSNRLDD